MSSPQGLDPRTATLGEIAEEPHYTIGPDVSADDAFRFIEERDAERVPVVEDGRLIGVLSRRAHRRLAADEDAPPEHARRPQVNHHKRPATVSRPYGTMLWLRWKTFSGSYRRFTSTSRS